MEFAGLAMNAVWVSRLAPVTMGALGGYLYYRFIGCKTGACPITSNPWISILYGALVGLVTMS